MSSGYFLIEVSRTDEIFFIAAVKRRNSNENYLIELEWEQSKEILKQFNINGEEENFENNYEKLVHSLDILDNRLVLLNPNVQQQKTIKKRKIKTRGSQSQQRMRVRKKKIKSPFKKPVKLFNDPEVESNGNLMV